MTRLIRRIFAVMLITSILLILAVPTAISIFLATERGRLLVQNAVNERIDGNLHWSAGRLSPWRGTVEFVDLSLCDRDNKELARAKRIVAGLSPTALAAGTILLDKLVIEEPVITTELKDGGRLDILEALAVPQENAVPEKEDGDRSGRSFPRNLIARNANVLNGSFSLKLPAHDGQIETKGIYLSFDGNLLKERARINARLGTVSLEGAGGFPLLKDIQLEGDYRKGDLENALLKISTDRSLLALRGSIGAILRDPMMNLSLEAVLSPRDFDRWIDPAHGLRAPFRLHAILRGTPANPEIELEASYRDEAGSRGPTRNTPLEALDLSVTLSEMAIHLKKTEVKAEGIRFDLGGSIYLDEVFPSGFMNPKGEAGLDGLAYRIELHHEQVELARLIPRTPADLHGSLESFLSFTGRGIDPKRLRGDMEGQISFEGVRYGGSGESISGTLHLESSMDSGLLSIDSANLEAGAASLAMEGSVWVETERLEAEMSLSVPDLGLIPLPIDEHLLLGALELEAEMKGTIRSPRLSLRATAEGVAWNDLPIGDIIIMGKFDEKKHIDIEELALARDNSRLLAQGRVELFDDSFDLRDDPLFSLRVDAAPLQIEDFIDNAGGRVRLSGNLAGSMKKPRGTITLKGWDLWTEYLDMAQLSLEARFDDEGVRVDSLRAEIREGESIEVEGGIGWNRIFEATVSSEGISLESIKAFKDSDEFRAKAMFNIRGSGTFDQPEIHGDLALRDVAFFGVDHQDFQGKLSIEGGVARLEGNAGFDIDATFQRADGSVSLAMDASGLPLKPYFLMAGLPDMEGTLDAGVTYRCMVDKPLEGLGEAVICLLSVTVAEAGEIWWENAKIGYAGRTLHLAPTVVHLPLDQSLRLEGWLGLDGTLAVTADGELPVALAGIMVEDLTDFTGTFKVSGRIDGSVAEPDMQVDLEIRGGGFKTYMPVSSHFRDINGDLRLRGSTVILETLKGSMDGGLLEVSGTMGLKNMLPDTINLHLAARNLPLEVPDWMNATLDSELVLRGQEGSFKLEGEITILEAICYRDVKMRQIAGAITGGVSSPPREPPASGGILDAIRLDIALRHRVAPTISNNLAYLEVVPDLRLGGTLASPVVNGRITVQLGTIYFLQREFVITRGVADFLNPYRTEATLNIEGKVSIKGRKITLRVEGPQDRLTFHLASDPPEDQRDIMSLLLTDRTTAELTGQPSGPVEQTATEMVAAIINATMADDIKQITGLDTFEIETTGEGGETLAERFGVTIGKDLSRRLAVKYSFKTKQGELVQQISTEYKLIENILAGVFQDSRGAFGGEIRLRLEFY